MAAVPSIRRLLIANRGEIAVRIARTARAERIEAVIAYAEDEADAPFVRAGDGIQALAGVGPAAFLSVEGVVAAAVAAGCDAVHPGYGFLSENPDLARACRDAGLTFVGPGVHQLEAFGDKLRGRAAAEAAGVPVLAATTGATDLATAEAFFAEHGPLMVKAIAGGGGRGMRAVTEPAQLSDAMAACAREAAAAFGDDAVYVEELLTGARHVEVQIIGDGQRVEHLHERDCTLQRRRQKVIETAPAWDLPPSVRVRLQDAAVRLGEQVDYDSLGTVEFLVAGERIAFIECNARLQVEHTVTEAITGLDLVQLQLALAGGSTLSSLGIFAPPPASGAALQARVLMETVGADGQVVPAGGTITAFRAPEGVRVDTFAEDPSTLVGYTTSPRYDSLLAKVVVAADDTDALLDAAVAALDGMEIAGVETNAAFLAALLRDPAVRAGDIDTTWLEANAKRLGGGGAAAPRTPGAVVDRTDPLAVLEHGRPSDGATPALPEREGDGATIAVRAPMQGTVGSITVGVGEEVAAGATVAVMEAMKMEHVITAPRSGVVRRVGVGVGDAVFAGHELVVLEPAEVAATAGLGAEDVDLDEIRPDLAEVIERHASGLDENRPDAVQKRRELGKRTARENVDDLIDDGSLIEYGPLVVAAQKKRRSIEDLREKTPGDGLVGGVATVDGHAVAVASYDYTVLAGTQGLNNHRKKDRLFEVAEHNRLPVVFFTEGGGGRPGDTDGTGIAGLDCLAFHYFGKLSGLVPLVGIASGRCFAGNAAILGCCDVVIATRDSNIGMGGPAMIEGGGLGVYRPEEVGPIEDQIASGVVDVAVEDEVEAVATAKQYLSYFTEPDLGVWDCADQRWLRRAIPENRLRVYEVRGVIETLFDEGSVLELRRGFGPGMVTALARIEGRAVGVIANDPAHLAGAIDSDAADKAARFMQLCDAHDLPIVFLCDTPGIMVGPDAERTGLVRHASRLFVTAGGLSVPYMTVVLRKGYGLGAQAMAGGSFHAPLFIVGWPTSEFGGMGLEGAVKLGYRNELAAIEDPEERRRTFDEMVERMYEVGKGTSMAAAFEIDDVIDPADTRRWITAGLAAAPSPAPRSGKKRPNIDTW
jgi:acetyl/propionyl-CoA carboxylase alpha subunit/acetyl-CoA carboxylase carboxyltransferase component